MSAEIHDLEIERRLIRMLEDAMALRRLSPIEIATVYDTVEKIRDALSRILDRADQKNA